MPATLKSASTTMSNPVTSGLSSSSTSSDDISSSSISSSSSAMTTTTTLTSANIVNRINAVPPTQMVSALPPHKTIGDLLVMSQMSAASGNSIDGIGNSLRGGAAAGSALGGTGDTEIHKSHNLSAPSSIGGDESLLAADNNLLEDFHKSSMYFGTPNSTVITTQAGATAFLPCTIHFLHGEGVVSTY